MFEVGKKVIAIKDSLCGRIKKWHTYPLHGIRQCGCKCGGMQLNVGLIGCPSGAAAYCIDCNTAYISDGIHWKDSELFAPYDDSLSSITVEELLEEVEGAGIALL